MSSHNVDQNLPSNDNSERPKTCNWCCTILSLIIMISIPFLLISGLYAITRTCNGIYATNFNVTSATLTKFNLIPNTTHNLIYNLVLNFTAYNPNNRVEVYVGDIQAEVVYGDMTLQKVYMKGFHQGYNDTMSFGPGIIKGENVVLGNYEKYGFEAESVKGMFGFVVKFRHLNVLYTKNSSFGCRTWKIEDVKCAFIVPLHAKSSIKFEETMCHYYV